MATGRSAWVPPKLALLPLFPQRPPTDWPHSDLSQIRLDDDKLSDNEMTKHGVPERKQFGGLSLPIYWWLTNISFKFTSLLCKQRKLREIIRNPEQAQRQSPSFHYRVSISQHTMILKHNLKRPEAGTVLGSGTCATVGNLYGQINRFLITQL